jgi:peptidoglycan hydrolase CwlO-like protein
MPLNAQRRGKANTRSNKTKSNVMFDIKNSKFYTEIMGGIARFFGMADATEAEIHQRLTDAGTLEEIQAKANQDAVAAVQAKMDGFEQQLADLQKSVSDFQAATAAKDERIGQLEQSVSEMQASTAAKDETITSQAEQISTLSTELAALKVAQPLNAAAPAPAEGGLPVGNPSGKAKAGVVTTEQLMAYLNN